MTTLLQVLCIVVLLLTTNNYYVAPLAQHSRKREQRKGRGKWCTECGEEVMVSASHCELCGECVDARQRHSFLLNRCVGASNVALSQTLMRRLTSGSVVVLALFLLDALLG